MQWNDMKPFYKGTNADGDDRFFIPLQPDEDGMVGRECPDEECQPRYFKITSNEDSADLEQSIEKDRDSSELLYCPYCGLTADLQEFTTRDQIEWVKSMMARDVHRMVQDMFKKSFRSVPSTSSRGMFSVKLSYRPGSLPSVRHYAEKELKRVVVCDRCQSRYAVYGISVYCPRCGEGNLQLHIKQSVSLIQSLLGLRAEIEEKKGREAAFHLLGNCLEDCVSLFEGFLKAIYGQALRIVATEDDRVKRLKQLGNSFQNLMRTERILNDELSWDLFNGVDASDREFMEVEFTKRHVITHNLSLVDEKFLSQAQTWQTPGQDVEITSDAIERLLGLIEEILIRLVDELSDMKAAIP